MTVDRIAKFEAAINGSETSELLESLRIRRLPRLLLVDDDVYLGRMVVRVLSELVDVSFCTDVDEAIRRFENEDFDVIFSDLKLPGKSGLDFLRRVRDKGNDIPFILFTGAATLDSAKRAIELNAFRYLEKPIANVNLVETLLDAINQTQMARIQQQMAELPADPEILAAAFERAVTTSWLALQPIVDCDRLTVAYELLQRCEESSLMQPSRFFEAAQRLNAGDRVGALTRKLAVDVLLNHPHYIFFLNTTPEELTFIAEADEKDPFFRFSDRVVLELSGMNPSWTFNEQIDICRARGFRFALDDLGSASGSIQGFSTLVPEFVKLDRAITRQIERDTDRQQIAKNIIALCRELDVEVVAKGIETAPQFEMLKSLGVKRFQGFFTGKSMH